MTDQEINCAIAIELGARWHWSVDKKCVFLTFKEWDGELAEAWHSGVPQHISNDIPSYTTDLNAIAEAEKAGLDTVNHCTDYLDSLCVITGDQIPIFATARQRAEAFLRTLGRWVENGAEVAKDL